MKYLKIFTDFEDVIELLSDAEKGRLFSAMLRYARTGESLDLPGNEKFAWAIAKQQLDKAWEVYSKKCEVADKNRAKVGTSKSEDADIRNFETNISLEKSDIRKKETNIRLISAQDKDKDKDKSTTTTTPYPLQNDEYGQVVVAYEENIGLYPIGATDEILHDHYLAMGKDPLIYAIELTNQAHPDNPRQYLLAILRRWKERGVKSLQQAKALNLEQKGGVNNAFNRPSQREPARSSWRRESGGADPAGSGPTTATVERI